MLAAPDMELTQAILLTTEVSLKAGEGKPNTGMDLVDILQEFVDISNEVELGKVDYKSVSEALARCQGQRAFAKVSWTVIQFLQAKYSLSFRETTCNY